MCLGSQAQEDMMNNMNNFILIEDDIRDKYVSYNDSFYKRSSDDFGVIYVHIEEKDMEEGWSACVLDDKEFGVIYEHIEKSDIDLAKEEIEIACRDVEMMMEELYLNLDKIKEVISVSSSDDHYLLVCDYNKNSLEFNNAITRLDKLKSYLAGLEYAEEKIYIAEKSK